MKKEVTRNGCLILNRVYAIMLLGIMIKGKSKSLLEFPDSKTRIRWKLRFETESIAKNKEFQIQHEILRISHS
jgi:hypothetical protein